MLAFLLALGSKITPFLAGINITSVFQNVWGFLTALGKNIAANWKTWLIGVLVLLQLGTGYGFYHEHQKYLIEVAAHKADNAKFIAAQQAANRQEQAVKNQLQTESKAAKNEADSNYSTLLAKYKLSLLRYAAGKSNSSSTGNNQLSAAQSADGPGESSELPQQITITGSDAEICAENTARLQAAHDWAIQQLNTEKTTNEDAEKDAAQNGD